MRLNALFNALENTTELGSFANGNRLESDNEYVVDGLDRCQTVSCIFEECVPESPYEQCLVESIDVSAARPEPMAPYSAIIGRCDHLSYSTCLIMTVARS